MKNKLHPSIIIGWGSVGLLIGVVAAQWLRLPLTFLVIASVVLISAFLVSGRFLAIILVLGAGFLVGTVRGTAESAAASALQPFINKTVTVRGVIADDPEYGKRGEQQFRLGALVVEGRPVPGKIWASAYTILDSKRGDTIVLKGKLRSGFGAFVAALSYATVTASERPAFTDVAREVRDWFGAGIRNAIAEPEASLGVGYLVGQRSALPAELDEQLKITGLTHIVVASGYNLTVLVRAGRRLFSRHSKYLAFLAAMAMITAFVLITGFSSSMSRAALVAGLSLVAWYYGRQVHPLLLLVFSAAITVVVQPFFIWGDIGWYLSFAAFAGVLLLSPLLARALYKDRQVGFVPQLLIETSAAQIITLPIILYMFGTLSLVALPANLLVLPLVPLAMLLTFIAGIAGVMAPAIAGWFGVPANAVLQYMTTIVDVIARWPQAQIELSLDGVGVAVAYGVLIVLMIVLWRRTEHDFRGDSIV